MIVPAACARRRTRFVRSAQGYRYRSGEIYGLDFLCSGVRMDMRSRREMDLAFRDLVPEEEQILEALLVEHPEAFGMLDGMDCETFGVRSVEQFNGPAVRDEALALLLVLRGLGPHPVPERVRQVRLTLEARVAAQPELRDRLQALEERLRVLEARCDPFAHFERLTGHKIEGQGAVRA